MKKIIYFILVINLHFAINAQTSFWTENFGTNPVCGTVIASSYSGSNGAWSVVSTGPNGTVANVWYVSPVEAGMGVGNCGDGCQNNPILINQTLHVSTNASLFGDAGATYAAGPGANTDLRAQSPTINCTGKSNITLSFAYIMYGVVGFDYAQAYYSPDNGVTWSSLGIPPQTPTASCSGQGLWTNYTVSLPASANNNSIVVLGFRWVNSDPNGADPSVAIDDVVLSTAAPAPTIAPTFTMISSICKGDSTQVTANTGTVAATGYTWSSIPAGPIIATPNASVTYIKFNTATIYTITLTASSGTNIGTATHSITVNPTPTITSSSSTLTMCNGQSATLTANGGVSYTWTPGNINGSPVAVSPSVNTSYVCTGSSSLGCKSSAAALSITVTPSPTISVSSTTLNLCIGQSATLTAGGAVSYTWNPGNLNGTPVVVSPSLTTSYTCTGTSSISCKGSTLVTITSTNCNGGTGAGIKVFASNENGFSIYPNPLSDKMNITAGSENLNNVKVEVVDILGKKVLALDFNLIAAGTSQTINTSTLPNGVYFVNTKVAGRDQKPIKIIKE